MSQLIQLDMLEACEGDKKKLEEKCATLQMKLDLYLRLTGLSINSIFTDKQVVDQTLAEGQEPLEELVKNFVCTQTGLKGGIFFKYVDASFLEIEYTLSVPEDTPFVSYIPRDEEKMINIGMPEHFSEEMQFELGMTDKFFWKITDWLQKSEQETK